MPRQESTIKRKITPIDEGNRDVDGVCHKRFKTNDRKSAMKEVSAFRQGNADVAAVENHSFSGGDIVLVVEIQSLKPTQMHTHCLLLWQRSSIQMWKQSLVSPIFW
jgi:hypothetical protein